MVEGREKPASFHASSSSPLDGAGGAAGRDPDGGPSAPADAKVAIVGSAANLAGKRFEVLRGRRVVLRGRLRRAPGTPAPWRRAFRADLTALTAAGRYVVRVGALRSRPWVVRAGGSRDAIRSRSDSSRPTATGWSRARSTARRTSTTP